MDVFGLPLADASSDLLAARNQMAFTLGFHIVLASLGVAFPAIMLIAEYRGRKHGDADALLLARRWSKIVAVTFAVGAVTGTVLSFEMGLLWPEFMDRFGDAFGIAFAFEGIFFFTEAIFIAIYIYGWDRLEGWRHFWTGVPIAVAGVGGALSVIAANAWMNQPQGFELGSDGRVSDVEPLKVIFNPATPYEFTHMFLAAYMVTGFLVASVYAVGMLRGRRDRYHRVGMAIPLCVAAVVTPVQLFVGDTAARAIAEDQPAKFAAMECVYETGPDQTEYIGGICTDDEVKYADRDPRARFVPGRLQHRHGRHRPRPDPRRRGAGGPDPAAPLLRRDGRDRHRADGPCPVARLAALAPAGGARGEVVPASGRGLRRRGDRRDVVRVDRHRGRPPALDRQRLHARRGGRDRRGGPVVRVRVHPAALHRDRGRHGLGAAHHGAPLARGTGDRAGGRPVRPAP